jgi:hypothetical protein
VRDRSSLVSGFGAGGGAVAFIIFILRIYAKIVVPAAKIGYDDYCISVAMVS